MTIAACFLTSGGVVLGADSTSTLRFGDGSGNPRIRHFDHAQKIFEVGDGGTLGVVTWGFGGSAAFSYRTAVARFADSNPGSDPTFEKAASSFSARFWDEYRSHLGDVFARVERLKGEPHPDENVQAELQSIERTYTAGFVVAGYVEGERNSEACQLMFTPLLSKQPEPQSLRMGRCQFWGVPDIMKRVIFGIDERLLAKIGESKRWIGKVDELVELVRPYFLQPPEGLPIREAIDYVHTVVHTTIKGLKFSHHQPVCGGPVEIAVITTDRRFRWVNHKEMGAAIW